MKFFSLQAGRRLETEFLAFDITSISSCSELNQTGQIRKE
ncbi:hypothetical protein HMPREF0322_03098 [Desulfitobacterium hafniense DP7]|uniref:Uncharacterized protein n=1 Tax=Desulfitobacterium hafniense DP7 TaxID=537010 RepID=G9XQ52_DESHA|nr:hypothetical protein HMPREF0322_03098 [Desulfitobacterium hafniense DP7]